MIRKAFQWIDPEKVLTKVTDHISATIPDQTIPLRDMILKFAYIGSERIEEIVNRGFDGDEDDDDILGVDVGALDYAEVHDRMHELIQARANSARVVHAPEPVEDVQPSVVEDEAAPAALNT